LIAPATAQQQREDQPRATLLSVNAYGMVEAQPDMATINVGVIAEGTSAEGARAENARRMTALVQALRRAGIAERDIQTSYVRVNPRYQHRSDLPPLIRGYEAQNTVRARVRDIDATGRVIDATVQAGGNQVNGVSFGFQEPEVHVDRARRDAIAVARRRADLYADALGLRVVRVISVSEAGAARPASLDQDEIVVTASRVGGGASTPIAPGELETRASVSVSYELR
jgi:uncharacterized protein